MSISRSRATERSGARAGPDRSSVGSVQATRKSSQSGPATTPRGPEWKSERWKLQVEAEARSRLKKLIRRLGSER